MLTRFFTEEMVRGSGTEGSRETEVDRTGILGAVLLNESVRKEFRNLC